MRNLRGSPVNFSKTLRVAGAVIGFEKRRMDLKCEMLEGTEI